MRDYKKKFQAFWMTLDIKPFGKWKRAIEGSNRMNAKKDIRKQLKEMDKDD